MTKLLTCLPLTRIAVIDGARLSTVFLSNDEVNLTTPLKLIKLKIKQLLSTTYINKTKPADILRGVRHFSGSGCSNSGVAEG